MDHQPLSDGALEGLLRFYADAGVDCLVEDAPIDRRAEYRERARPAADLAPSGNGAPPRQAVEPTRTSRPVSAGASGHVAVPDEAAVLGAKAAAAGAETLDELRRALEEFTGCSLRDSARTTVFADGNPQADIMFVGEAPGREEDIQGLPFVGRAGQLLDRMLAAIDLDRQSAYITNMIVWRPPGNRNPTPHEIELSRPFIERHIVLAEPKLLVFLGNVSNKALMHTTRGILSMRGTWGEYVADERRIPVVPTLHPAYLLRNPAHKRLAWQDFLAIRDKLDSLSETV